MWQLLRQRSFRNLWLAGLITLVGSQTSRIALVLHVALQYGSVNDVVLLLVLETLPGALVAPLAGVVIDRFDRSRVMVASNLVRAAFVALVLFRPTLGMVYAMAVCHSLVTAFFQPSKTATLPTILPESDLVRANTADQAATQVVTIVAPVAGAYLLLTAGLGVTLALDSLSFLAGAWLVRLAAIPRLRDRPARSATATAAREVRDGLGYLWHDRTILHMVLLLFGALCCTSLWLPIAPFFIRDYLGGAPEILGWQMAAFGWGSVVGSMCAPRIARHLGKGATVLAGMLFEGVAMTAYALVPDVGVSLVTMMIWGVAVGVIAVPFYSLAQVLVRQQFAGRVFALVRQSESVALLVALAAAVLLQGFVDARHILLGGGLIYCAVTVTGGLTRRGRTLLATP